VKPRDLYFKERSGYVVCSVADSSNESQTSKPFPLLFLLPFVAIWRLVGKVNSVLMIPFKDVPMMKLQNIAFQ